MRGTGVSDNTEIEKGDDMKKRESKKNLYLLLILIISLLLTAGHFAYTWSTEPANIIWNCW